MDSNRVVQITDLHILADAKASLSDVNPLQSLTRVIEDIESLLPQPRVVIASGDLSDDGSPESYRLLRQLLLKLSCPVYVMVGNHDDPDVMVAELPGDNIFYQKQVDCDSWRVLLVDSKLPGSSFGLINDDELDWLHQKLEGFVNHPVLIAMHHTPLHLCASPSCRVKNADAFLSRIKNYGQVKGLVAGHTHNAVEKTVGQLQVMTTPSTMVQVTHNQQEAFKKNEEFWEYHQADISKHGYRVVDLNADGTLKTEVKWVDASQA